jgi:alkanesulfonate monooxygenase SsuD/methylene tetrahydromethanopterin reductase-like flavin-dependent oxidoreductase (luciferase family)
MIATNDVLSQGRVTMGIGVSWVREQFETPRADDVDLRGAVRGGARPIRHPVLLWFCQDDRRTA